ncbi:MAG: hypothetical protein R3282_06650 [Rhodothermales bacterium]|nr:hypothetical protein [Rhodothermales bacterium]
MPQTMLAVLSMVVTTLFAFNQHRNVLNTRLNMVKEDMAIRSTGVAVDVLEEIGSMSFDEATRDAVVSSSNELTSVYSASFREMEQYEESTNHEYIEAGGTNDIDDFNGAIMERTRTLNEKTLGFRAEAVVGYVDPVDKTTEVNYPTKLKKVTIKVFSKNIARPDTIYLSQIFSCGSRCNW